MRGLVDCYTITLVSINASYLFFYFFCRAFKASIQSFIYGYVWLISLCIWFHVVTFYMEILEEGDTLQIVVEIFTETSIFRKIWPVFKNNSFAWWLRRHLQWRIPINLIGWFAFIQYTYNNYHNYDRLRGWQPINFSRIWWYVALIVWYCHPARNWTDHNIMIRTAQLCMLLTTQFGLLETGQGILITSYFYKCCEKNKLSDYLNSWCVGLHHLVFLSEYQPLKTCRDMLFELINVSGL